jgi:hypothetical protein
MRASALYAGAGETTNGLADTEVEDAVVASSASAGETGVIKVSGRGLDRFLSLFQHYK